MKKEKGLSRICSSLGIWVLAVIITLSSPLSVLASVYGVVYMSLRKTVIRDTGERFEVSVQYEPGVLPEGCELEVREISPDSSEYQNYLDASKVSVDGRVVDAGFMDISIIKDGVEIEPGRPVKVEIRRVDGESFPEGTTVSVVHFDEKETVLAETDLVGSEDLTENLTEEWFPEVIDVDGEGDAVSFTADSFSVYGVIYTVDFKYDLNGETFEFSLAGGDSISIKDLLTILHITDDPDSFLSDVEDISFSDEELAVILPITEGISVSGLKDKYDLECEYSADLSDYQIEELNAKIYYSPDWVFLSLKPFTSEEYMTFYMVDGEVFTVTVTDAQIKKDFISAKGETFEITVTYDDNAGIPEGSDLKVRELETGSEEYVSYLQQASQRMGLVSSNFSSARFFDIEIIYNGEKIEPKVPVGVEIKYKDTVEIGDNEKLQIIHFADTQTEIIDDVAISEDGKEVIYKQRSFSITGQIVSTPDDGEQRMVIVQYNDKYYIVNNDATLTEIEYDNSTNPATVSVADPMLWTFEHTNNDRHIYFNSEATGFGTNLIASDYYRRYLDPNSESAWLQEQSTDSTKTNSYVTVTSWPEYGTDGDGYFTSEGQRVQRNHIADNGARSGPLNATDLIIDNGKISNIDGTKYLAVKCDAAGTPVCLVGGETDSDKAANFLFARTTNVPTGLHSVHTVNHIDISISGAAQVKVPLAYGKYYDADGNEILDVTENTKVTLTESQVYKERILHGCAGSVYKEVKVTLK